MSSDVVGRRAPGELAEDHEALVGEQAADDGARASDAAPTVDVHRPAGRRGESSSDRSEGDYRRYG